MSLLSKLYTFAYFLNEVDAKFSQKHGGNILLRIDDRLRQDKRRFA